MEKKIIDLKSLKEKIEKMKASNNIAIRNMAIIMERSINKANLNK